ncbi:dsDNA nuclease domain-containing protein [Rouxiella badensis]|uniref:dsDNA nuclease domain-containing protein n=1 Tax=Rouxiella badensis TaxID=1646377 RepID=UPI001D154734|nr:dsDNA nuclease domain-containing protein [Rouxiella badensis]MCC3704332.1 dsDNA nuclease domain-containing protein [Rouxiella badensis]
MSLADALVNTPQDERGGEIAIRGFEYQRCWAIDELLNRHKNNETYVFIPEYHDDILILDSSTSPNKAIFAQVKTRDSHWTITPLLKAEKDGKLSFISKLFKHKQDFSAYQTELAFITNALFKFFDKYEFNGDELNKSDKEKILAAIKKQLPKDATPDLSSLKFKTSKLSLLDYDSHLVGKTFEYLEDTNDAEFINAPALKKTLVDLFEKKTRVSSREISSFDELIEKKGISNELIAKVIDKIKHHKSSIPDWEGVLLLLSSLNKTDFEKLILKGKYDILLINLKNINSIEYKFYNQYKKTLTEKPLDILKIPKIINDITKRIESGDNDFSQLLDDGFKYIISCCAMIEKLSEIEAKNE